MNNLAKATILLTILTRLSIAQKITASNPNPDENLSTNENPIPDQVNTVGRKLFLPLIVAGTGVSLFTTNAVSNVSRSMDVTIENKTSKTLTNRSEYFDNGEAAGLGAFKINPGETYKFKAKKKAVGAFGVKGVVCFRYDNRGDFVVFFETPYSGPNYHGAEIYMGPSQSAYENYKRIPKIRENVEHNRYESEFNIYSYGTSGTQATLKVVITEKSKPVIKVPPSSSSPAPRTRTRVSAHGSRLRAHPDGKVDLTFNDGGWERWSWNNLGNNRYTWKSAHGTYLRAHPNGKVDLAPSAREWEVWTKVPMNGKNAWRSAHGTFLRAQPNGQVDLVSKAQGWELWTD
jgi:hypothetical protein